MRSNTKAVAVKETWASIAVLLSALVSVPAHGAAYEASAINHTRYATAGEDASQFSAVAVHLPRNAELLDRAIELSVLCVGVEVDERPDWWEDELPLPYSQYECFNVVAWDVRRRVAILSGVIQGKRVLGPYILEYARPHCVVGVCPDAPP